MIVWVNVVMNRTVVVDSIVSPTDTDVSKTCAVVL